MKIASTTASVRLWSLDNVRGESCSMQRSCSCSLKVICDCFPGCELLMSLVSIHINQAIYCKVDAFIPFYSIQGS